MKRNYISIVTISALFYQLLIAPLSAMTDCAVQDTGMRKRIAVVTSVPVDNQNVLPFSPMNKQDLENKRIAEANYAFETKVIWIATLLFVVGLVVSLFYPLKTFLSSFDEAITGSTSYSPFAFFAQQDMHAQFNATTTIPYLKDHFQNNTQMQNTLVEAACHYMKKEAFLSNITDALVGYADFFMGSFKYISVIQQVVAFTLCFNPVTNVTSALNVIKGSIYGIAYNLQPPVCENPDDLGVAFNVMKRKPELAAEYPSVDGAYKLVLAETKKPDLLIKNHYGTARREFVAQSAEDVHDLIQDSPQIPNLIFNLTQQVRSHICPADIMMTRLEHDAFSVLSPVIAPSNYTFFYFWFNRHGGLVRTNYSTDGMLGNISASGCDWQSRVFFGNDAHVRIAFNAYGRMWITNQQLDFLPETATVEKTHTRKLSLSKGLPHTDTWRQSASEALADTNTTEQSASEEYSASESRTVISPCILYNRYLQNNTIAYQFLQNTDCDATTLDLSGKSINNTQLAEMAPAIQYLIRLTDLHLSQNNIGPDGIRALAPALQNLTQLTYLSLWGNNISDTGLIIVAPVLKQLIRLTIITLSQNNIGPDGIRALAPSLQNLT